jgi:hypothetical protein
MGTGSPFHGGKADHSPPSSAEVKNDEATPPLPHMSSWYSRDNFTLPFTQIFSSYLTRKAMHLHFKDHLANAVYGNNCYLFS